MNMTKAQVAQLVRAGAVREIFEHASLGLFDIAVMRHYISARAARGETPQRCQFCDVRTETGGANPMEFLISQREIDPARVAELTAEELEDPVIFVICPAGMNGEAETHLLVDGNHRIMARHQRGYADFLFWPIPWHVVDQLRPPQDGISIPWGQKEMRDGKLVDRE